MSRPHPPIASGPAEPANSFGSGVNGGQDGKENSGVCGQDGKDDRGGFHF
jgi:hypothetical protein